ncbi:hypothetical protein, partial [Nocardiopsis lucentensis]|uniref:hypothetical protein n=1 Tax=Nocardiopsis lucentensis TaxID=53441 RepID=UPI00035D3C21
YMRQGVAGIRDRLTVDMVAIQQSLAEPQAWATAAVLAVFFAKTMPLGDHATAVQWYRRSAALADRSEDVQTRVWVRGRASLAIAYDRSDVDTADLLATQALALDETPTVGRLSAQLAASHVAAVRGDAQAAADHLDDARRTFDAAGVDEAATDFNMPWWRFKIFTSGAASRTGDERAALAAQEEAERTIPVGHDRYQTHLDMHRGLLLAKAGDRRGGTSHATTALNKLPAPQRSVTLRRLAEEVRAA